MSGPILLTQNGIPELTFLNERHEHCIPASARYLLEAPSAIEKKRRAMFGPILLTQNGIPELTLPNERHEHRIPASAWYLLEAPSAIEKQRRAMFGPILLTQNGIPELIFPIVTFSCKAVLSQSIIHKQTMNISHFLDLRLCTILCATNLPIV